MPIRKIGNLQIESEATSQSTTFWRVQSVVIIILLIFLIGALFGLTGPGILGQKTIKDKQNILSVNFDPFARQNAMSKLEINIDLSKELSLRKKLEIYVSKSFINNVEIKQIMPMPTKTEVNSNYIVFTFLLNEPKNNVIFYYEPQKVGLSEVKIGIINIPPLSIKQFIYP